jgi:PAS domain S-box-containing protein
MKKEYKKLNLKLILLLKKLKETEKSLKYELAKNKAIIENSNDCIKILDKGGNIIYMNKGGLKEHNFTMLEEAIGWNWLSSIQKSQRSKIIENLKKCLKGESTTIDVKHIRNSNRKWCSMTLIPIKDEHDKTIQILAISRDISKRKEIERELRAKIKNLQKLLKKKKSE